MSEPLHAFGAYGIELEYMLVDRQTLDVRPISDRLLGLEGERQRGAMGWSNELALHQLELKNVAPQADLHQLLAAFQGEIAELAQRAAEHGARLMPSAMHPWMNPRDETRLWPHANAAIYQAYDRIFDCRVGHGWSNLQSMHLNLPFAGDAEFSRLHAAIRLVLPILPALAASSPYAEGRATGWLDYRLHAYSTSSLRLPSLLGPLVPESVASQAEYAERILEPIYRQVAPFDPAGVLHHDWINARAAIPRFGRSAIEIRVIDVQECPQADLAIAAITVELVRALYQERWTALAEQQAIGVGQLQAILQDCSHEAEAAEISDANYLRQFGVTERYCRASELWALLLNQLELDHAWRQVLALMLQQGTLARRLLRVLGQSPARQRLRAVYAELCDCLAQDRLFT